MKTVISKKTPAQVGYLVVPLFSDKKFTIDAPAEMKTLLSNREKNKDFKAGQGEHVLLLPDKPDLPKKILLFGFGKSAKLKNDTVRSLAAKMTKTVMSDEPGEMDLWLPSALNKFAVELGEGAALANYNPAKYQTGKNKDKHAKKEISAINLHPVKNDKKIIEGINYGLTVAEAVNQTRDLVNGPNNYINSDTLSAEAKKIAKEGKAAISILDKKQLEKMNMGALIGVNLGSARDAKLVVMEYKPAGMDKKTKKEGPVMLVGKGITFDSGGYNLKPTQAITNMKEDMAGAAVVMGVFRLLHKLGIKKHVIGITPLTDNLIGSKAQKVNDIVTTYSGKTVEITNTDAEGRLVLADAIAYGIDKYKPSRLIDLATLTGACMVALGDRYAGLFGNNDKLINDLKKAGDKTDELVWHLPIHPDFRKKMKGKIADLQNSEGSGLAGASKGAAFIENFVGKTPWAHLDIAGVTFVKDPKPYDYQDATGFGVRLLVEYLSG